MSLKSLPVPEISRRPSNHRTAMMYPAGPVIISWRLILSMSDKPERLYLHHESSFNGRRPGCGVMVAMCWSMSAPSWWWCVPGRKSIYDGGPTYLQQQRIVLDEFCRRCAARVPVVMSLDGHRGFYPSSLERTGRRVSAKSDTGVRYDERGFIDQILPLLSLAQQRRLS